MKDIRSYFKEGHLYVILALCLTFVFYQTYAEYHSISMAQAERVITEEFTVVLALHSETKDLFAWEATVTFNPNVLLVLNVNSSGFLSSDRLMFNTSNLNTYINSSQHLTQGSSIFVVSYADVELGKILLAETKVGSVSGASGSGTLATVTFGVFGEGTYDIRLLEALLLDSKLNPIEQVTLTNPADIP